MRAGDGEQAPVVTERDVVRGLVGSRRGNVPAALVEHADQRPGPREGDAMAVRVEAPDAADRERIDAHVRLAVRLAQERFYRRRQGRRAGASLHRRHVLDRSRRRSTARRQATGEQHPKAAPTPLADVLEGERRACVLHHGKDTRGHLRSAIHDRDDIFVWTGRSRASRSRRHGGDEEAIHSLIAEHPKVSRRALSQMGCADSGWAEGNSADPEGASFVLASLRGRAQGERLFDRSTVGALRCVRIA